MQTNLFILRSRRMKHRHREGQVLFVFVVRRIHLLPLPQHRTFVLGLCVFREEPRSIGEVVLDDLIHLRVEELVHVCTWRLGEWCRETVLILRDRLDLYLCLCLFHRVDDVFSLWRCWFIDWVL